MELSLKSSRFVTDPISVYFDGKKLKNIFSDSTINIVYSRTIQKTGLRNNSQKLFNIIIKQLMNIWIL